MILIIWHRIWSLKYCFLNYWLLNLTRFGKIFTNAAGKLITKTNGALQPNIKYLWKMQKWQRILLLNVLSHILECFLFFLFYCIYFFLYAYYEGLLNSLLRHSSGHATGLTRPPFLSAPKGHTFWSVIQLAFSVPKSFHGFCASCKGMHLPFIAVWQSFLSIQRTSHFPGNPAIVREVLLYYKGSEI